MNWFKSLLGITPDAGGLAESWSNFTPRAHQVLALAREEAQRSHHAFIGTEHLLLGLIRLGQGTAVAVLQKMGADLESVRLEVEKLIGTGPNQKLTARIPYTPRVKQVLALAAKEAKALKHSYVGTEHILLGLLREGDGVAARVLKGIGLDTEVTRQYLLRELDPNYPLTPVSTAIPPNPESAASEREAVDTSKRYEDQQAVYRNALFKGITTLFATSEDDVRCEYVELEQNNGQTIFVARSSVTKFCEPGTTQS